MSETTCWYRCTTHHPSEEMRHVANRIGNGNDISEAIYEPCKMTDLIGVSLGVANADVVSRSIEAAQKGLLCDHL